MNDKATQDHLADLSDAELIEMAKTARDELAVAAHEDNGSEWHQACFAGVLIYATELQRRGLNIATIH